MKSLFLLVVLLPLCHSSNQTLSLTKEIISRLRDLNNLYVSKKVIITSWDSVKFPSRTMQENTSKCMNVFKKELKHLLENLTVVEETRLIEEITTDLEELQTTGQLEDNRCIMQQLSRGTRQPFQQYISFLKKFNNHPAHG